MRISVLCLVLAGAAQSLVTRTVFANDSATVKVTGNELLLATGDDAEKPVRIENDTKKDATVTCQRLDMAGKEAVANKKIKLTVKKSKTGEFQPLDRQLQIEGSTSKPFQIRCNVADKKPFVTIAVHPDKMATEPGPLDAATPPDDANSEVKSGQVMLFVNKGDDAKTIKCEGALVFTEKLEPRTAYFATIPGDTTKGISCTVDQTSLLTASASKPAIEGTPGGKNAENMSCDENAQVPPENERSKLADKMDCGETNDGAKVLCVDVKAQAIGTLPELDNGDRVRIKLLAPDTTAHLYRVEVENQRNEFASVGSKLSGTPVSRGDLKFVLATQHGLTVRGPGTLVVRVSRKQGKPQGIDCTLLALEASSLKIDIGGKTRFRAGIMIAYVGLVSRSFARDSDMRIVQEERAGMDIALTLTAYPLGVLDGLAFGFLLGTPFNNFGTRWLSGVTLESPYGFGITAGAALALVPELDNGLRRGQPFAETTIPTSNTAAWTWFVGVNVDAALFARAFEAILPNSSE